MLGLRPTQVAELGEVILERTCQIESPDGEVSDLKLSFTRPRPFDEYTVQGSLRFACKHFDEMLTLEGGDGVEVLTWLLGVGRKHLAILEQKGFTVWWIKKGDLDFFDFWSHQKKPTQYCLQSAFEEAASEAFQRATEGRFLMPSHRVAIEIDRPAITTYRVREDGSDAVGGLIGPDVVKRMTPDELCRRLGRMILMDSDEGRRLLGLGRNED